MVKYNLKTWFEQEVFFEVKAKNKKEAIEKAESGIGEVDWNRQARRGEWEIERIVENVKQKINKTRKLKGI